MFNKKETKKQTPVSYEITHTSEVVDLFGKLNLHHQTALLRLISRNLVVTINGESAMGYEMNFEVNGALIEADNLDQTSEP